MHQNDWGENSSRPPQDSIARPSSRYPVPNLGEPLRKLYVSRGQAAHSWPPELQKQFVKRGERINMTLFPESVSYLSRYFPVRPEGKPLAETNCHTAA